MPRGEKFGASNTHGHPGQPDIPANVRAMSGPQSQKTAVFWRTRTLPGHEPDIYSPDIARTFYLLERPGTIHNQLSLFRFVKLIS